MPVLTHIDLDFFWDRLSRSVAYKLLCGKRIKFRSARLAIIDKMDFRDY